MPPISACSRRGFIAGAAALCAWRAGAQTLTGGALDEAKIDEMVEHFRAVCEIPGVAIAILSPDRPAFVRGYGIRQLGRPEPVDAHTSFAIASNSKAFTAAALALLVDDGKLAWDEPVRRYLPEFRMYDPAVTDRLTVRDLLVHRSGLAAGAGDLMQFPPSSHVAADVLKALPHLKPVRGFRAGYDYDNILYVVAGLLIARIADMSWHQFIATRLLAPLGMTDAVPATEFLQGDNIAAYHARLGPPLRGIGPLQIIPADDLAMLYAAGGIHASAADLTHWLDAQLRQGVLPSGQRLWSERQAEEMWKPQTLISSSDGPTAADPGRPVLSAYALGWFVQDYRGERLISHSGGLTGQITQTALMPGRNLAVAVLTNTDDRCSKELRNALLDLLIGAPAFDWAAKFKADQARKRADALSASNGAVIQAPPGGPSLPLERYAGLYRDPWYGDIRVNFAKGALTIDFVPTPLFKSPLEIWGKDAFRTRFPAGVGEDALVSFIVRKGKVQAMSLRAFSPLADFSYDFVDLAPVRVGA